MERNIILDPKIMKGYACNDGDEGKGDCHGCCCGGFHYFERGFWKLMLVL